VVGNGQVIQTAEVNRGAYDVGGGWNRETYAAVELIESHKTKAEFERDYKLYCELLKQLAKEAGVPATVDSGSTGVITHDYARKHQPANKTDHVDPYPYLAKWGITPEQFAKDVSGAAAPDAGNANNTPNTEEIDMYLINCKDNGRYYISNGVDIRYIKTTRMLENYKDKYGKLNLRVDTMFQAELDQEFGKEATSTKRVVK
jgi:hypothetical protein